MIVGGSSASRSMARTASRRRRRVLGPLPVEQVLQRAAVPAPPGRRRACATSYQGSPPGRRLAAAGRACRWRAAALRPARGAVRIAALAAPAPAAAVRPGPGSAAACAAARRGPAGAPPAGLTGWPRPPAAPARRRCAGDSSRPLPAVAARPCGAPAARRLVAGLSPGSPGRRRPPAVAGADRRKRSEEPQPHIVPPCDRGRPPGYDGTTPRSSSAADDSVCYWPPGAARPPILAAGHRSG